MKICPTCQKEYEDDAQNCADDGALLVAPGVRNNPRIPGVRSVDSSAHTAMFSLEDMQKEMEHLSAVSDNPDLDQPPPPPEPDEPLDPNVTRALRKEDLERMRRERDARDATGTQAPTEPPDRDSPFTGTRRTALIAARQKDGGTAGAAATKEGTKEGSARRVVSAEEEERRRKRGFYLILGLLLALLGGGAITVWAVFLRKLPVEVVSSPPGATILVDNVERGVAPLLVHLQRGAHAIKATLAGYQEATEVIDVSAGRALVITLKRDGDSPNAGATDAVKMRAEALWAEARALLEKGRLEDAEVKCQAMAALVPDDNRPVECLRDIAEQRARKNQKRQGGTGGTGGAGGNGTRGAAGGGDGSDGDDGEMKRLKPGERKKAAARAYDQARTAYDTGDLALAKDWLGKCLRYDPDHVQCHRVLARVYTKEDNVPKARYHLQRYLELGGSDDDFKVRDWLRAHPAPN